MLGLPGNRVLPENYDKAEKTEKYLKTKSLFKELQFFCSEEKKKNDFHACTRPRSRFNVLESLFTRIHGQKHCVGLCSKFWECMIFSKSSIGQHFWYISTLQSNIYCLNGIALTTPMWKIYHACSFLQICLDKLKGTFTYFLTIYIKIMFPFVVTFSTSKLFFLSFLVLIICDINDCKNTMEVYLS